MRFVNDLPVIQGASDCMDSAFFAGMLATFDYPGFDKSLCEKYIDKHGNFVRHPVECDNALDFSRDQTEPLASGSKVMAEKALKIIEARHYIAPNGDIFSPSQFNNLEICAGRKQTLKGKINLIIDILYSAYWDKEHETNQLLCMCKMAGPFYLKLLVKLKKDLKQNIRDYYCGWRNEPEFADHLIKYLEKY